MAQIRKFEQDAIVNSTVATIIADKDDTVATLEATPEYAGLVQMANTIKELTIFVDKKIMMGHMKIFLYEMKVRF